MGKWEEDPVPADVTHPQPPARPVDTCSCCARVSRLFRFRCVIVLVLGVSVLLSAVFWLPPFFRSGDRGDLDLDSHYKGHDIVATFMVQKPLSLLQDDLPQLGGDIFDELRVPTTKVVIIKAESIDISNTTKIIFGVDPDEYNSKISSYAKSLVRDSFVSLVLHQSPLSLTESLFGEPSSFEVLKFVGGITVTPDQSAYPLQEVLIRFNFTLNFSIQQILDHFSELTSQLKSGLRLDPYENLHISLTNAKGSTVATQTTVQSSIVLAFGTPSTARSKQLEQTIKGSPTKNLGLNNTQFGRVKQISLSSYFNSSSSGRGGTLAPSPAPQPHSSPQQPHHNHHHHHHHGKQLPPVKPPSPSKHPLAPPPATTPALPPATTPALPPAATPAPHNIHYAKPPDCHSGYHRKKRNINNHPPLYPPVSQPALPPHIRPPPLRRNHPPPRVPTPPPLSPPPPPPLRPPPPSLAPPIPPPPPVSKITPASSPLPNVVFACTPPPSKSDSDADPPDITPSGSILQPSSAAAVAACAGVSLRAIPAFLAVMILENIIPFN